VKKLYKLFVIFLLCFGTAVLVLPFLQGSDIAVLNPKGIIGLKQKELIITSTWLMLIVVIPVFLLTLFVAWRYKESNKKSKYDPNWDYSFVLESLWWAVPFVIIFFLSVIAWKSSHELDPFKPIENGKAPLKIQTVALQWRWLFIYPEQGIATINYVQFPEDTPLEFEITADAPMNSFWIPQLGGQIYAMPGMRSKLYLIADKLGTFRGSSANLSGKGFAQMAFEAKATSQEDFHQWVQSVKSSSKGLNLENYNQLALPTEKNSKTFYVLEEKDLYDQILMKYTMPDMQHGMP
jgi:cytochrome o ubiquinol oxidase subunit 2